MWRCKKCGSKDIKIIVKEKYIPKMKMKERCFLESFRYHDTLIIRDSENKFYIEELEAKATELEEGMFESLIPLKNKKQWSIGELLELEVMK